jgi:hypothetical protein
MTQGGMEIIDCNNHVKSATKFFGPSCAVNCLTDKFNPIGDNSDRLCQLCIGRIPGGRCTSSDPYAGYEGAFRCLQEAGDIAFLKHDTITQLLAGHEFFSITKDSFELLCTDGSRRPVDDYLSCNWGRVPSDAIVTSSAVSFEDRRKYQLFLEKAGGRYKYVGPDRDYQDTRHDGREPQYDQFGNKIEEQYDQYGNRVNEENRQDQDRNRGSEYGNRNEEGRSGTESPEYDQFGNRLSRYKRQNFGNFGGQSRPRYEGDYYGPGNRNDFNRNRNESSHRAYVPDPSVIYGGGYDQNVDPYQDGSFDRNRDQFESNITVPGPPDRDENGTLYEVFSLFGISRRYKYRINLLFQVITPTVSQNVAD